jgi:hypothetical protein
VIAVTGASVGLPAGVSLFGSAEAGTAEDAPAGTAGAGSLFAPAGVAAGISLETDAGTEFALLVTKYAATPNATRIAATRAATIPIFDAVVDLVATALSADCATAGRTAVERVSGDIRTVEGADGGASDFRAVGDSGTVAAGPTGVALWFAGIVG